MATGTSKDSRSKPKSTSTISWVTDKLAAGAARVNGGEFQDVEIAVVKATNHDITPPKEKHVRTLREIISTSPNRKKVIYIVHTLYERLVAPNESWLVVLKALMVFHKLFKADGEATFKKELIHYKEKRKLSEVLRLTNFADKSQKETWDYSAFVRVYSSYLEERLCVFEAIKFDIDRDGGGTNVRFKTASGQELLDELPRVQKMLQRILTCLPEGHATDHEVITEAMRWLLTECFRLYRVISEGVINLAEQFFEMDRVDASKGLEMYRESINSTSQMQDFFNAVQNMSIGRQIQFPQLTAPPEDFLTQMEEYVRSATGRNPTRKFQSTVARNAQGSPSAALTSPTSTGGQKVQLKIEKPSSEKPQEIDLLGLDALDFNIQPVQQPVAAHPLLTNDPFADAFQTSNPNNMGFVDDWNQSTSIPSPMAPSVATDQNASPFDNFFSGDPMVQPPAPEMLSPGRNSQSQEYHTASFGTTFPTNQFQQMSPASNNPFGDVGFDHPSSMQPPTMNPIHYQNPVQATGPFSGPGAFADPFAGLTTIQKKQNYAAPGEPMRQDQMGGNPFVKQPGLNDVQRPTGQQDFPSFF